MISKIKLRTRFTLRSFMPPKTIPPLNIKIIAKKIIFISQNLQKLFLKIAQELKNNSFIPDNLFRELESVAEEFTIGGGEGISMPGFLTVKNP